MSMVEWDFPLHWGWGKLAELWLAGLVWTPTPWSSTDPKRRFLGAVALRDRGRKLYPDPGGRAGTSEAEADCFPNGLGEVIV